MALAVQRAQAAARAAQTAAEMEEHRRLRKLPPTCPWVTNREWFAAKSKEEKRAFYARNGMSKTDILRAEMEAEARREAKAEAARRAEVEAELRVATETRQSEEAALESALAEESMLRAAWEAARAARIAQEARVETALAEETRLTGLLDSRESDVTVAPADEPESSLERRVKATDEEADADEPEAARRRVKVVRFLLPDDSQLSLEGKDRPVEAEEAYEPEKAVHGEPAEEPVTAVLESPAEEPILVVEQGEAKVEVDSATDEPEPSLEGMVKVGAVADEPELPLEGRVKVDEEIVTDEPEPSLEGTVKVDNLVADEPELLLEGRVKADEPVADAPEASLERKTAEDATAAYEPELEASSEEQATATAAITTLAQSETETSYGEEVMMTDEQLAEPIPEEEQGEERATEPTLAQALETALLTLAYEPETAECQSLADEPMSETSFGEEDKVKAEPLAQEPETVQQMLAHELETAECKDLDYDDSWFTSLYEEGDDVVMVEAPAQEPETAQHMLAHEPETAGESLDDDEIWSASLYEEEDNVMAEPPAQEPETAQHMLAHEPETAGESLDDDESWFASLYEEEDNVMAEPPAQELETAQNILAYVPETAWCPNLADEPMPQASYEEEGQVKAEGEFSNMEMENNDPMLLDAPAPTEQRVGYEMAERGRLAAIHEQIQVAQAHAAHLAELQRAEAQRRAQEEWELAQALALQQAHEAEIARARAEAEERARQQHDAWLWEQAQAAARQQREEQEAEDRALGVNLLARLQQEEDARDLQAALAAAEFAHAEDASMPEPAAPDSDPDAGEPNDANESESEEDDEDTSLNEEELQWLNPHFEFTRDEGDSLFGSTSEGESDAWSHGAPEAEPQLAFAREAEPMDRAVATRVGQMPTTTPAIADQTPSIGGIAVPNANLWRAAHQTIPAAFMTPYTELQAEAADAETASAEEAEQRLAGPAPAARRKVLPARGVRGSKEAKLRAVQELRETQAAQKDKEEFGEELCEEDLALCKEVEEGWAAEMEAEEAKVEAADEATTSKGKEVAKSRAEVRAEARAKAALEYKQIEEARQREGERLRRAMESASAKDTIFSLSEETPFRPVVLGEEAMFDPRSKRAYAAAQNAHVMGLAAEEAKRSAQMREVEEESEVSDADDETEEEEDGESYADAKLRWAAEWEAQRVLIAQRQQAEEAEARVTEATAQPVQKRSLDSVDSESEADNETDDDDAMDMDGARVVRVNRRADKRADKPETDKKALALFGDMPPAIELGAQLPAGTVFAQEKPFIPMYGAETFSGNTRGLGLSEYIDSVRSEYAARTPPAPAAVPSPSIQMVSSSSLVPPPSIPSRPLTASNSLTPSRATFITPKKPLETPKGASLADQLAELERTGSSSSPRPSPRPTPPSGATIVRKPAPSLFIERKKPKKPTSKPGHT